MRQTLNRIAVGGLLAAAILSCGSKSNSPPPDINSLAARTEVLAELNGDGPFRQTDARGIEHIDGRPFMFFLERLGLDDVRKNSAGHPLNTEGPNPWRIEVPSGVLNYDQVRALAKRQWQAQLVQFDTQIESKCMLRLTGELVYQPEEGVWTKSRLGWVEWRQSFRLSDLDPDLEPNYLTHEMILSAVQDYYSARFVDKSKLKFLIETSPPDHWILNMFEDDSQTIRETLASFLPRASKKVIDLYAMELSSRPIEKVELSSTGMPLDEGKDWRSLRQRLGEDGTLLSKQEQERRDPVIQKQKEAEFEQRGETVTLYLLGDFPAQDEVIFYLQYSGPEYCPYGDILRVIYENGRAKIVDFEMLWIS